MSVIDRNKTYEPKVIDQGQGPRQKFTTRQMAQALTRLLAARDQLHSALQVVPNAVTRNNLDDSLRNAIREIIADILAMERI